ncbi:hypothetical protein LTR70_006699 [Exophiala xenobiotica]|uniref:Uncharacterized protein n=1 Tax=Lithohypha guttulata TaxID=1690604 RepID=A0ABR0K6K4_9EURO|nr:hypothetical protein LTR24_006223 [Lithohypha guttulata]KAK5315615.1 hypothetical protein LTR70_006699 [Exophiala xenobiotica]
MANNQYAINDYNRLEPTGTNLSKVVSSGAVTMSPEIFEKLRWLYLTPKVPHAGDNIKRFANPTPLGFVGGIFFFVGPLLLTLGLIFEWIMGNFFSMMVMGLFAVFWLSFGLLQLPMLALTSAYSATGDAAEGAASVGYNATIALYLIVWGFALLTFFIFTLKTNMIFAGIFFFVTFAVWVLSGAYWKVASGDYVTVGQLQKAGGALLFIVGLLGWYMTFVMMAAEMRLAIKLPVGDLSHFWPRTDVEMATAAKEK